jgi:hypothetical protein
MYVLPVTVLIFRSKCGEIKVTVSAPGIPVCLKSIPGKPEGEIPVGQPRNGLGSVSCINFNFFKKDMAPPYVPVAEDVLSYAPRMSIS